MIISSSPPTRRWPFGTSCGVQLPRRSLGTRSGTLPTSVATVFSLAPLREFAYKPAAGSLFS